MFISHSTSADETTARLRDAIAKGLEDREHAVLLDVRRREPGRPWQLKLARMLAQCEAALVLVNEAALGSSWVRRETNILHWRKTLRPDMVLVTVLVGEVTAGLLRASELRYLADDDVERLSTCSEEDIEQLVRMFPRGRRTGDDAMSAWLDSIGIQLQEIKHEPTYARIARELDIPQEEHDQLIIGFAPALLACQMLDTHDVVKLCNVVLVARDGGLQPDRVAELAKKILPVWVDRDQARRIVRERDGSVRRVVILNVDNPLIGEHYLDRAFCVDRRSYYIARAAGRPPGDDDPEFYLLEQCEQAVKQKIGLTPDQKLDHPREPRNFGRLFLLLDANRCDLGVVHRVIAQLHEKIPWISVLVISGRGADVRDRWPGSPDEVLVLDPPFEAEHENVVNAVVERVRDCVGHTYRGA
ncbi:toll/interleukin-1 receptor domain-containing protein [Streptomyces sp. NPDC046759]|uniref:toll/interleukin-1 receptor domain-containing protein n=1 Tax=Streptomyces sp. NPDC046759 TaxID=3155019 RepID=UPI0033CECDC1